MAGNEMIRLSVKVIANGQSKVLTDYLVGKGKGLVKLRQASVACGLLERYTGGLVVADDFCGHKGRLKLGIERDRSGRWPPKNVIAEYLA